LSLNRLDDYLRDYLEEHGIDTSKQFTCINPEHDDNTPSANVFKRWVKCHGCGALMDIYDCAAVLENKPAKGEAGYFKNNVMYLAKKFGVEVPSWSESEIPSIYSAVIKYITEVYLKESARESDLTQEEMLEKWIIGDLKTKNAKKVAALQTRKTPLFLRAPNAETLIHLLAEKGFDNTSLREAGIQYRFFPGGKDRLAIPLWSSSSTCVAFMTRKPHSLDDDKSVPKYINTPNNESFTKSNYLYGSHFNYDSKEPINVVEGQKDVLAMRALGLQAYGVLGSSLTDANLEALVKKNFSNIVISMDACEVGKKKTFSITEKFLRKGIEVSVRVFPDGEDPWSYIVEKDNQTVPATKDGIKEYCSHLKATVSDEQAIYKLLVDILADIKMHTVRKVFIKKLSKEFPNISTDDLKEDIESEVRSRKLGVDGYIKKNVNKIIDNTDMSSMEKLSAINGEISRIHSLVSKRKKRDNSFMLGKIKEMKTGGLDKSIYDFKFRKQGLGSIGKALNYEGIGWSRTGTLCLVAGESHTFKTGMMLQMAIETLLENPNAAVFLYSTDDIIELLLPRLVSCMVFQEGFKISDSVSSDAKLPIQQLRDKMISKIEEWIVTDRLIGYDMTYSKRFLDIAPIIKDYKEKYPERTFVIVNDNMHRNKDYLGQYDESTAAELKAADLKETAIDIGGSAWASVEYKKTKTEIKGVGFNNDAIVGGRAVVYDASIIIHMYNDLVKNGNNIERACYVHQTKSGIYLPRSLMTIGKNKISSGKGTFYFDLYPGSSFARAVDSAQALREYEARRKYLKDAGLIDDGKKKSYY